MKLKILTTLLTSTFLFTGFVNAAPPTVKVAASASRSVPAEHALEQILHSHGEFSMFAEALKVTGMDKKLRKGNFTILAPTNAAFAEVPQSTMDMLMFEENRDLLIKMVSYHIIPGIVASDQLKSQKAMQNVIATRSLGSQLGAWKTPRANIVASDVRVSSGLLHAVDSVLIPKPPNLLD